MEGINRREFLWLSSMSAAGLLIGCATNPVTGRQQLMLMSENQEIQIDHEYSPQQFSTDYGTLQDKGLNDYISRTGEKMAKLTHRSHMPYSFRGVNATYVNAYAFPGGSIAATRGILLTLENEAALAGLLGHELGHVNARHTAEQMSKGMLTQAVVGGIAVYAGTQGGIYGQLASTIGMLGAGALLAKYSRDNEREADALGMEYTVKSGYSSEGFVGLMDMLKSMSNHKTNALELLFATHPMSEERYQTAVETARTQYSSSKSLPIYRERYMDHTANLRKIKGAITAMQLGEGAMAKQQYHEAEANYQKALTEAPDDYAGLVMMSKCQLAQKKHAEANRFAEMAKQVYPQEAQAYYVSGFSKIQKGSFDSAYAEFSMYEKMLPGNPNTIFYKGLASEGMQHRDQAASEYYRYLKQVNQGGQAKHAYQRLVEWGYVQPQG